MAGSASDPLPEPAAHAAPSPKERVTPMDRVRWSRQIARMRAETPPRTWGKIASATGKSVATCKRLEKALRESGDPEAPDDPMRWVWERFDVLRVVMEEASQTYEDAPLGSAVRVGALRRLDEASASMFELARGVGFVPRHLGALSAEREMQQMFRAVYRLLEKEAPDGGVSDAVLEEMLRFSQAHVTRPTTVEGRALSA